MTCVPCVAVLEPGSAPESRTDSKRDSEEEPVRELELEVRRESIELRSIELRRVCEHGRPTPNVNLVGVNAELLV